MESHTPNRVALLISSALGYSRNVLRGIKGYTSGGKNWICHYADPLTTPIERLVAWGPCGVIAAAAREELVEGLVGVGVPVVNVSSALAETPFARVTVDNEAIGEMAGRYFLERGFARFGYVGLAGRAYSAGRHAGLARAVRGAGRGVAVYHDKTNGSDQRRTRSWATLDEDLRDWVAGLGRPCAVMACDDWLGMQLAETCRYAGLRVPEDVAIVGVDNDDLLCDLSNPSLSSVSLPGERVGYEAAGLLDRMLGGGEAVVDGHVLPPIGVVTRRSSDVLAIDDVGVAASVRFIRANAGRPMNVEDVVKDVKVSRRSLERRFRRALGRSPLEEIRRAHVERARHLLAGTDLSMPAVAKRSGFVSAERLSVIFRQETGTTPTRYRRQFRLGGGEE